MLPSLSIGLDRTPRVGLVYVLASAAQGGSIDLLNPAIVARGDGSIHGVCLVASQRIRAGEVVWDLDEPMYTRKEIDSWSEERREAFDWYGFQCGVDRYSLPEGLSREMNHSCDPNSWWAGSTTLVARRDIEVDEEVTYDYSTCDIDHVFEMECSCGSARCRGTISNRDYLDSRWQGQYGSNLPPHVLAAIARAEDRQRAAAGTDSAQTRR